MTNNQSYSAALTWAVSHFEDSNFDDPLLFLRDENTSHGGLSLIYLNGSLLRRVQQDIIKIEKSKMNLMAAVSSLLAVSSETNTTTDEHSSNLSKHEKYGGALASFTSVESKIVVNGDNPFCVSNRCDLPIAFGKASISETTGEPHVVFSIEEGDEKGETSAESNKCPHVILTIPGLPANGEQHNT